MGNDPTDSKSYTGYAFTLGGVAISWKSRKQRTVALSTTEAEYKALTDEGVDVLERSPQRIGIDGMICCDYQGAIKLSTATGFYDRTKHARIHLNFVKNTDIQLEHMPTDKMVADIFTKSLPRERHMELMQAVGMSKME